MPPTIIEAKYRELVRRIQSLRRQFVPEYNAQGTYTLEEQDGIRAFVLLTHAALERYLEDVCSEVAQSSCTAWGVDGVPRHAVIALLGHGGQDVKDAPGELSDGPSSLRQTVERVRVAYRNRVFSNNGIKQKDVLGLLLPVGVLDHQIDAVWLASVDSFGSERGGHAHASDAAQTPRDAADVVAQVAGILFGMRKVNRHLSGLLP